MSCHKTIVSELSDPNPLILSSYTSISLLFVVRGSSERPREDTVLASTCSRTAMLCLVWQPSCRGCTETYADKLK